MKQTTYLFLLFNIALFTACNRTIDKYLYISENARITPAYVETYIPYNIAPLNFCINETGDAFSVRFVAGQDSFEVATKKEVNIPSGKWKKLLEKHRGENLLVCIFAKRDNQWYQFQDLHFKIAEEPIDPYIAYRLIEPGYSAWGKMGLYQRNLENFKESPIMLNTLTDKNCMNCHSFHKNNPDRMLFHLRGQHAGTLFLLDGEVKKINTKAPKMVSAGVYPRWHPEGRFVAFSTNSTHQGFHTSHANKVEVFDTESDIVMYDTQANRMFTSNALYSKESYETFPEWSPDGKYLYFCTAPALTMPKEFKSLKYSLVRIAFDSQTGTFANQVDTLVSPEITGKSVSLPRISPDGKYLIFCQFDYGTFPIWHRENDLYILNTETKNVSAMTDINSHETDSYHSFSSNGRWLIFSSRRLDGNYTRLFISYFDKEGKGHKPFLLPQKHADYYDALMKSYNIPEFMTGKVENAPAKFNKAAWKTAEEMAK
ncbi:cytochrome c biosynthesis protein [Bacteroidia bacterium]|nr:cytochrome c biosynthesis protein [Bacteroidia bacterium]GHT26716.1 cytochrome c biosynthesis protein [Bacteroidia bacterium]